MGYEFGEKGFNFIMPGGINKMILNVTLLNRYL